MIRAQQKAVSSGVGMQNGKSGMLLANKSVNTETAKRAKAQWPRTRK